MPRSEAEDSTSSSGENDSSMALSDLSSPPGDDVQPSDGPAPEAAASATKRDRVEPDRIARPREPIRRGLCRIYMSRMEPWSLQTNR